MQVLFIEDIFDWITNIYPGKYYSENKNISWKPSMIPEKAITLSSINLVEFIINENKLSNGQKAMQTCLNNKGEMKVVVYHNLLGSHNKSL